MTERSAALWVETRWSPRGGGMVIFRSSDGEELSVEISEVDRSKLESEKEKLRKALDDVKRLFVSMKDYDWKKISEGFEILRQRGALIALQLFNHKMADVSELFKRVHPLWEAYRGEPLLMEVDGPLQDFLPFEFLPLFSTMALEVRDLDSLTAMARRFVGFSFFVRRHFTKEEIPRRHKDRVLENDPKLPVKFFYHAGLNGALTEVEFFRAYSQFVDFRGPWPTEELEESALRNNVAGHVVDPCRPLQGDERQSPDQVQHFACHCDTGVGNAENGSFKLSHDGKVLRRVTLKDLQLSLIEYMGGRAGARPVMPLIFVNACASAVEDAGQMASFHRFFLEQNQNRGFIGTEIRVPDSIASTFSKYFYSQLLDGIPLGTAIHMTRWKLLELYRNPLGLLYTVHADPEIHVQRPIR